MASLADAADFLQANPLVYLLGRRADGFPTAWPMTARVRAGAVDFSTYAASAKVRHLLREGVAGVLAVAPEPDGRVLVASGPVRLMPSESWFETVSDADADTDADADADAEAPDDDRPDVPAEVVERVQARHQSGKRAVLRVDLEQAEFTTALAPPR
jgi:hypothetical protein